MVFILSCLEVSAQTCLQKLDSAERFIYSNPQKSKFYATSLLANLDSNICVVEIGYAAMYNNLALILLELNEKKRGLEAFHQGLRHELMEKDSLHRDLLGLYYNLSAVYQEIGQFQEARKYIDLAGKITSGSLNKVPEAEIAYYYNRGIYEREVGDFEASLKALNQALEINGNNDDSIRVLLKIELGTTRRHFGDMEKSEEELMEAVELAKSHNELLYLQAIDRLSSLKIEQGEYSDAENYLLYNLKVKNQKYTDDPIMVLETLNELGFLYHRLHINNDASKYLNMALETGKNIRTIRPYMENNLGTIYMEEGRIDEAEDFFLKSSEGFKQLYGTLNPDYASTLNNLASVYKSRNELGKALNLYTKVLDLDKVIYGIDHPRYATSLNNVALLYLQLGNFSLAGKLLEECKQIREVVLGEFNPMYIKTLNDLGIYHLIMKDTVAALNSFNRALKAEINHMQDIFPVLTDNQRKLYFDETRYNIERFCSLAFSAKFINTSYSTDALNHFINTKGILFYASEKMRKLIQSSNDQRLIDLFNEWRDKKYRLAQSYLLTLEEQRKQGISIEELEEECTDLEKTLSQSFRVFSDQDKSTYHTWEEISDVLKEGSAIVDIIQFRDYQISVKDEQLSQGFEDKSKYMAFIIKPNRILEPVKWSDYTDFDKGYNLYKNSLKFGIKDVSSYEVFWEPLSSHLQDISHIYLSPDGIYHKLNPIVFYDQSRDMYVMDEYDIVNITSGKDLLYQTESRFIRDAKIFGNPNFTKINTDFKLNQLPGAEQEASDISNILDVRKWKSETYYFDDATEETIKTMANPGVLHIATHGYFKDDPNNIDPLYSSGLFLTRADESGNDGILTAYEAMNLVLDETSLVVLAACETGLGTIQNGEGVFGLQRAFLVAGAKNVLISLVKINDNAARTFMNMFYKQLLEKQDSQQAFFAARTEFKKVEDNPYNWGAYILVSKSL
ncbi:MAG: CHAT domain-containing protein [Bacteroidota bacterium]